jgi:hypothetical protein
MSTKKSFLLVWGLILFIALLPAPAQARVHLSIGIGTSFDHHHGGFYFGYHPRTYFWGPPYYLHGPLYPWPGYWFDDCHPIVTGPPVVFDIPISRHVIVNKKTEEYKPPSVDKNAKLFEKLRLKKHELLRQLKIGSKENRLQAIRELTGFTFDEKVADALEEILLNDPDPELRKEVAVYFGKTNNKNLISSLEQAKNEDPESDVRQAAANSINSLKGL